MAITHFTPQLISRGNGRSAVLSAAYRHCAKMSHEAEARTVDYSNKQNLAHEEFLLPPDAPNWARDLIADRSVAGAAEAFWNAVEAFEKRSDAQLAKEFIIALPVELTREQNVALVRQYVSEQVLSRGQVADWVYHDEPGNPHIHLMTTLRPLTEDGFGSKKVAVIGSDGQTVRTKTGKIQYKLWSGEKPEFLEQRQRWLDLQNHHLALAGLDIRVDGRSYTERGIDIEPTTHIGVAAKALQRKADETGSAVDLERLTLHETQRQRNAARIEARPELVLDIVTSEMSVFDYRDIAKVLHRYIDNPESFQQLLARVTESPECLKLTDETIDFATGARVPARLTTRAIIKLEAEMVSRAGWLSGKSGFGVQGNVLESVFGRHERLSDEQRTAIEHVAGPERIAAVVGRAGAGKTTMMKAAREAWEQAGYTVVGGALAGKAAEGLEKEAGIPSRTLSSWELAWQQGRRSLNDKTIFVLDEAGMVSCRQMATFVEAVTKSGAKLVLVGDAEQLQPIEAGAAFRAITERRGYAELATIYRQHEVWMRNASMDLARGQVEKAVLAYDEAGLVQTAWSRDDAIASLIADWGRDLDPEKPALILAYFRRDVRKLNELAREHLIERGLVGEGSTFKTEDGERHFDAGDRIVFLKNEGSLDVKNGMLAKVVSASSGRIVAEIGEGDDVRQVEVDQRFYRNLDHGYATTIHKAQGVTTDDVRVLASRNMDRHLTYVALTRHRDAARLYVGMNEFTRCGGVLVDHGIAPFEHDPKNRDSHFVTLETSEGQQSTIWGVDLQRAIKQANAEIGDRIGLEHKGSQKIKLPDGKQVDRHRWEVVDVRKIAVERLIERLSLDGSKETTLDYTSARSLRQVLRFADTRGLHLARVARTLMRDRVRWTIRQKLKLLDLGLMLRAAGARLGLVDNPLQQSSQAIRKAEPMVKGISNFTMSVTDAADKKLQSDPGLRKQWDNFSDRMRLVYADPEAAFNAMKMDAVVADPNLAQQRLGEIEQNAAVFGALKGKEGLWASRADRDDRRAAEINVPALRRGLERYLDMRQRAKEKYTLEEEGHRKRTSIDIPSLSPAAERAMEKVRDAIDRNDLPAALGFALADKMVAAELDEFNSAVSARFGERTLLTLAAKDTSGSTFNHASQDMSASEREKLKAAWPTMRAGQQMAAHERTQQSLKESEALRQTQRQSQGLKL